MKVENQIKKTIKEIGLSKKEKILVAISGGKDSAVLAYFLSKLGYNIEGLHINLGIGDYSLKSLDVSKKLAERLGIKLHVFDIRKSEGKTIKYFWRKNKNLSSCSVCGVFKKWVMNREAKRLNVDKIATGHNLDDEALTFFLNILKGAPQLSYNTGVVSRNKQGNKKGNFIPRVKPLFYVYEEDILKFAKKNKILFVKGKCPFRENSYRVEIERYFKKFSRKQKRNLIKNFEGFRGKLKGMKNIKENYCEICREACTDDICKKCKLVR